MRAASTTASTGYVRSALRHLHRLQFEWPNLEKQPEAQKKPVRELFSAACSFFSLCVVHAGYVTPVAAAAYAPLVEVQELYLDTMFAVPSAVIAPPKSLQIPYQDITLYIRQLSGSRNAYSS